MIARRQGDYAAALRLIERAVEAGAPAPSGRMLEAAAGLRDVSGMLRRLQKAGVLLVETDGNRRRFHLLTGPLAGRASGWSLLGRAATAWAGRRKAEGPGLQGKTPEGQGFEGQALEGRGFERKAGQGAKAAPSPRSERRPAPARVRQRRDCLTCGRAFMSDGAHNRLCDICRKKGGAAAHGAASDCGGGFRVGG